MKSPGYKGKRNIIAKRLIEARKKAGLTQDDLAARLQVREVSIDQQTISKIELNQRAVTDYEVAIICESLKISPEWILGEIKERDEK